MSHLPENAPEPATQVEPVQIGHQPIAVVGVSAIFPGSTDAAGFWSDILAGRDLLGEVPPSHWLVEDYFDADPKAPDKTYARRGGFLPSVDFDALGWGVPPSIIPATDTAQLLALMVAKQVLEDAWGARFSDMDKSRMSCILGVTSAQELLSSMVGRLQRPVWVKALREAGLPERKVQEISEAIAGSYVPWQEATFPGLLGNVVAGRIANRLDLGGTNCVTDAACASTFSALHMAVNELYLGDSDVVIAGGVDTMNDIFMYMCFSKTPALSASGDCRPFSDQADGTMLGEGLGMVALKRLADAERDGDQIYAVLQAVGSSSDGRSKSVYAPVSKGQAQAIRRAYQRAGYGADTVELVEAHGTGTKAGDAAEFGGLQMVFDEAGREDRQWCALGSVKSQIGHTKAAAGAAGLFKAIMALHHKVLPPTVKVDRPNPKLEMERSPFYLNTRSRPWVRGSAWPRRAGVSSFGFGGSNFHVALEEYAGPLRAGRLRTWDHELVVLQADSKEALAEQARTLAGAAQDLRWAAWRSSQQALTGAHRLAVVASDLGDLAAKLRDAAGKVEQGAPFSTPRGVHYAHGPAGVGAEQVAFLFPGQGSQYVDMGSAVAMHLDAAAAAWDLTADVDMGPVPLHDVVFPRPVYDDESARAQDRLLTSTEWAQPAIGAASLALLGVVRSLGLAAGHVAGHSYGEVTALHAAGRLSAHDTLRAARRRGELMAEAARLPGAMTAVAAEIEDVRRALAEAGLGDPEAGGVVVANHNHPHQVVLSGATEAIERAEEALEARHLAVKRLHVSTAFHSPVVAPSAEPFAAFLGGVEVAPGGATAWCNATAAPYPDEADAARRALGRAIAEPVHFVDMIEAMYAAGARCFVEVGPGNVLTKLVDRILKGRPFLAVDLDRRGKDGLQALLDGVARLVAAGHALDLAALWAGYRAPNDPASVVKPKLSVPINGANVGKPYPPAGGAAALPPPNPEPVQPARSAPAPSAPPAPIATPAAATPPVQAPAVSARPAPAVPAGPPQAAAPPQPAPPSAASPSAPARPMTSSPYGPSAAWLQAFQDVQRQTAEAHSAYQQAMADSHAAFLQTAQTSIMGLATLAGGLPQVAAAPAWAAPAVAAPAVAAPAFAAPAPAFVASAPSPVAPPPVVAAPVAPAPAVVAPAPVAPAPVAVAPAAPGVDVAAVMLDVVAEKTGYPAPMLSLDMDMEGDLGIDSIKRVEILSAVKERVPGLPEVDPAELSAMRTLGQIVDRYAAVMPAAAAAPATAPAAPGVDVAAVMLDVVAEKTGYPAPMLSLDMDMEGDLGIDSIKRVEILSAVKERVPGLPEVDPAELSAMRTLGQIVDRYAAVMPAAAAAAPAAPAAPAATAPAAPGVDVAAVMLDVVAEKTGYPAPMLSLDMDMEGDLGIDSIKRVEILSAVKERVPGLPEVDPAELSAMRTLGQIVDRYAAVMPAAAAPLAPAVEALPDFEEVRVADVDPRLGRFVLEAVPAPLPGLVRPLPVEGAIGVTADEAGVGAALVAALRARGRGAVLIEAGAVPADLAGLVLLEGLAADPAACDAAHRSAFLAARAAAPALSTRGGLLVTVQDTGGRFGLGGAGDRAWLGGFAGLARTAAQEWPLAVCKAIDLERGQRSPEALADALAVELLHGGPELEVGLLADGGRLALRDRHVPVEAGAPALGPEDVVVVSGGARGVTAATVIALARATGARFVLLGRTALEDEPACCRGAHDDAALKRALLADAVARGDKPSPAALGRQVSRILGNREIHATLAAIATAGGQARYEACDVTDAASLGRVLTAVRAAWGPITGIVHGAGVLRDKLIADKSGEDFDAVWSTKISGLRALLAAVEGEPLKVIALFSSVAARCGNQGQVDYAMANEVLNKVAEAEAAARPGCVVKSFGWGPWEGGMVTPALKARFEAMGVPLIPLEAGARMLADELGQGQREQVSLVLGGRPRVGQPLAAKGASELVLEVQVDRASHPYLADHSIQGVPVVPVVLAVEWFARAARAFRADLELVGIEEIKVLRGIPLRSYDGAGDRLQVAVRQLENGDGALLSLELRSEAGRHYSALARMMREAHPAQGRTPPVQLDRWDGRPVYGGEVLFHGPAFQVIRDVEGMSKDGIAATLVGVDQAGWQGEPWQTDVAALDGGLQLALLWTEAALGGRSLPTGVAAIRLGRLGHGPLRAVLKGRHAKGGKGVSDLVLVDADGATVAEMTGVETHVLPTA